MSVLIKRCLRFFALCLFCPAKGRENCSKKLLSLVVIVRGGCNISEVQDESHQLQCFI